MGRNSSTAVQLLRSFLFLCLVLALLSGSGWWVLRNGLSFAHLSVAGVEIRDLSLNLDRGLVLRVRSLDLPRSETPTPAADWDGWIAPVKKWGYLIQEVEISDLSYRGQSAAVSFRDGVFRAQGERFSVDAALAYSEKTVWLNLLELRLEPWQLVLSGHASYVPARDRLLFAGRFTHPLVAGSLGIEQQDGQVAAALSTEKFPALVPLLAQFPLPPDVLGWIGDNISAADYRIKDLRLRFNLRELREFGPDNISGTAVANAVAVRFHPELEPVRCDRVHISFVGDRLSFALDNPVYKARSLQGSSVVIDNVVAKGSTLGIDLLAQTAKDRVVDEILDKYDINFPARQTAGSTRVNLRLLFDLSDFTMAAAAMISSGPGTWAWRGIPLQTDGVSVQLVNGQLRFVRADLAVADKLQARVRGSFDIGTRHGDLQCTIDSLTLAVAGSSIVQATGVRTPFFLDFHQGVILARMPELGTTLRVSPEKTDIDIDSLLAAAPLSPLLRQVPFTDGRLHLAMTDPDHIRFAGEVEIPNEFLSLGGQPVTRFQLQGASAPTRTDIALNDNNITVSFTDELAVNLNGYLLTLDTRNYTDGPEPSTPIPLRITGTRSLLRVKDQDVATGRFELRMKDADFAYRAELEQGNFAFASSPAGKSFVGRGLDAALVDNFMKNADLSGGTMNVVLRGQAYNLEGYLEMNNILIRGTKLLNNILAFINAVPALATLSSPGFDLEGYRVNEGVMYLHYRDKILTIDELRTDGVAINTAASGWINNIDRTLALTMDLITLKDYSWILEKIPLAGYAILGEDGSLSTSLDISGSLDNPEIRTNLTQEILMSPINIIKRTVEWPFRLFDQLSGQDEAVPEPEETAPGTTSGDR